MLRSVSRWVPLLIWSRSCRDARRFTAGRTVSRWTRPTIRCRRRRRRRCGSAPPRSLLRRNPYFGMIEVTFENDSPAWQQIDHIDLDFGSADRNRSVQIPWGDDLDTWFDAVSVRNAVRAENEQMVLGTLALVGAVGRAAGGRHGHAGGGAVAHAGGALAVGALGALYINEQKQEAEAASAGPRFGYAHLLSTPIRVPPGLFAKRWIRSVHRRPSAGRMHRSGGPWVPALRPPPRPGPSCTTKQTGPSGSAPLARWPPGAFPDH